MTEVGNGSVPVLPTIILVTPNGILLFDEESSEIVASSTWDRMCRIDLKPVDDGEYQILALSYFTGPLSVSERFAGGSDIPLDSTEVGVDYLYTHANPSTFGEIDRFWSRAHIPQALHQMSSLLA